MNHNIFCGKKIRLRAKTMADLEREGAFMESVSYDTELDRLCDHIHPPSSLDARREGMERDVRRANEVDNCNLVIETLEGVAVGGISITLADSTNGVFSYGLGISRDHWRRGYASEAICLLMNYYFNELRFHKCNVTVYGHNEGSQKLHAALGFAPEGCQRESKYTKGTYHDIFYYGITKDEFNTRFAGA